MEVREVLQRLGPRAAASHETAARLNGLELLHPGAERVTVPRNRGRAAAPGWRVHRADLAADEVVVRDGMRTTAVVRTVADLATVLPLAPAVVVADSAVRLRRATLPAVVAALSAPTGRGAARPRAAARLVRADSGSVLETLLWVLLALSGLPMPLTQVVVRESDGAFVARVDFAWPSARLVVEADGFAFHSDRASYRRDRERLNALERLGWRVLRFTWEDVRTRPPHVVATVAACLADREVLRWSA